MLHPLFTPHAVLQRDLPLRIWGNADPGEAVTVTLAGKSATASGGKDGKWSVVLDPIPAGGPYDLKVSGKATLTVPDVLIGEVFLASGQSNMQFTMTPQPPWTKGVLDYEAEVASADVPTVRFITAPTTFAETPASDINAEWTVCSPATAGKYSGVAFYFARKLARDLGVPVGIIASSVGSSTAEAWIATDALSTAPAGRERLALLAKDIATYPQQVKDHERALKLWKTGGQREADKPKPVEDPHRSVFVPALLFNGMIAPYTPATVRGFIWYQGESNASRSKTYVELMSVLIADWRKRFGRPDMSFYFVQLAGYHNPTTHPTDTNWSRLRDAQRRTVDAVPHTGMATAIDVGDPMEIHPRDKKTVGERLALLALRNTFGRSNLSATGPAYRTFAVAGPAVRLEFDPATGPIVLKGTGSFTLAGVDRVFHPATAQIRNGSIVVTCPDVPNAVAARYAWEDYPVPTLYNEAGLPASPFRTDDW